ncbi:MAG TPA: chemotaxis protein CheX [Bryobacteraceae bacterium]|nr:chemotaxis protein CheX [Bryobacteraceae bacterium]
MPDEALEIPVADEDAVLKGALALVSGEVLETMFFSEVIAAECEHGWLESAVAVQVTFDGSHRGEMWLAVGEEAVPELAAAFLGLDPGEAGEIESSQVMLELANILCGSILSSLWPESSLQLDAPKRAPWGCGGKGAWHCCLMLPEGRLAISIRLLEKPEAK